MAPIRQGQRLRAVCVAFLTGVLCLLSSGALGEETTDRDAAPHQEGRTDRSDPTDRSDSPNSPASPAPSDWFILFAFVNTYPKLESEDPIDQYFNPAMRLLAPGFDDVYTISDLRDDHLLWPPHVAIGRNLGEHWTATFEFGYAAGKVRTKADDTSIFLAPLHTDFEIKREALYWGPGLDFCPLGHVEMKERHGLKERLRDAKPSIGTRVTWTYASYDAKVKAGLGKRGHILDLHLDDSWFLTSANFNVGVDVPLTDRSLLHFNGGYNIFDHREYDFEGPAFTVAWKWFFK